MAAQSYHTVIVACILCISTTHVFGAMQDLSHYYDNHLMKWPGHKGWQYELNRKHVRLGNNTFWLEANSIDTAEHMGTHIDAPAHLYKGGQRLDEISLDRLIGPLAVIDTVKQAKEDRDYLLSIKDVENYEDKYGRIPDGAVVFMNNGYDEYWFAHNKTAFLGTDAEDITKLHYPGFHPDTVEWLIQNRQIRGIGSDCVSFDIGMTMEFGAHVTAFSHNVWGIENLANLGKAPAAGATVHVMPIKVWQASGGPSRVVAFWDTAPGHAALVKASIISMLMSICTYIYINILY